MGATPLSGGQPVPLIDMSLRASLVLPPTQPACLAAALPRAARVGAARDACVHMEPPQPAAHPAASAGIRLHAPVAGSAHDTGVGEGLGAVYTLTRDGLLHALDLERRGWPWEGGRAPSARWRCGLPAAWPDTGAQLQPVGLHLCGRQVRPAACACCRPATLLYPHVPALLCRRSPGEPCSCMVWRCSVTAAAATQDPSSPNLSPPGLQLLAMCVAPPTGREPPQLQVWALPCPVPAAGAQWRLLPGGSTDLPGLGDAPDVRTSPFQASTLDGSGELWKFSKGHSPPLPAPAASHSASPAALLKCLSSAVQLERTCYCALQGCKWLALVQPRSRGLGKDGSSEDGVKASGAAGHPCGLSEGAAETGRVHLLEFGLVKCRWRGAPVSCQAGVSRVLGTADQRLPPAGSASRHAPLGPAYFEELARQLQGQPEAAAAATAARAAAAALAAGGPGTAAAERPQRFIDDDDPRSLALFVDDAGRTIRQQGWCAGSVCTSSYQVHALVRNGPHRCSAFLCFYQHISKPNCCHHPPLPSAPPHPCRPLVCCVAGVGCPAAASSSWGDCCAHQPAIQPAPGAAGAGSGSAGSNPSSTSDADSRQHTGSGGSSIRRR